MVSVACSSNEYRYFVPLLTRLPINISHVQQSDNDYQLDNVFYPVCLSLLNPALQTPLKHTE